MCELEVSSLTNVVVPSQIKSALFCCLLESMESTPPMPSCPHPIWWGGGAWLISTHTISGRRLNSSTCNVYEGRVWGRTYISNTHTRYSLSARCSTIIGTMAQLNRDCASGTNRYSDTCRAHVDDSVGRSLCQQERSGRPGLGTPALVIRNVGLR
jgi:hypothetical protein